MANDFALGKALEIPQSVLKNIDAVGKKISNISTNAERMAKAFNSAFTSAGGNANTFIQQLTRIQDAVAKLGNSTSLNNLGKGFGNTASQAERVVNSVTRVATTMNKLSSSSNSGFSPNNSVLAWQGLQKNIEQVQQRQEQLLKITREYENELARINSGKGGVISKSQTESYQSALKEMEANKQVISSYREKQQAIIAYQAQQRKELQNLQALKDYESKRTSLPEQRSANELKKLNDYYRELEKSSAKAAEAQEKAAQRQQKAQERAAAAAEKAAQREAAAAEKAAQRQAAAQAKLDSRMRKSNYQSYVTSTEGSLRTASKANTYAQRAQAINNLEAAMKKLRTTDASYQQDLDRLTAAHRRLTQEQEKFRTSMGKVAQSQSHVMDISGQLQRRIALIFSVSQISSFLIKLRDVTGEFELQNTALAAILKNQNQANILFQQITDLAVRSPFTVKELTTYTKSLSAYGLQYDELYDTMKRLADVSSGLGVDMQRLILAYGQVKAANYLRGTETRQFTEAGLNLLQELSKYYTEVEGKAVSLADVQDRQFKRMIAFDDVAAVFKRLTDEGGTFYQMQEKQADTIAGQVSNLQDSIDIMLNSIGQANRGAITTVISAVRTLVENWQVFVDVASGAGVAVVLYTAKITKAAFATGSFSSSMIAATAAGKGFRAVLATIILQLKNFGTFIKSNPLLVVGAALVAVGMKVYDHAKNVQAAREQYDLFNNSLYDSKKELADISNRIDQQNKKIKEANDAVQKAKKGSTEYIQAQEKANSEIATQSANLDELKQKFPEVYSELITNADGTIDLAAALEHYNKVLADTEHINNIARDTTSFFNEGFEQNLKDASDAQVELNKLLEEGNSKVRSFAGDLKAYFQTQDEDYSNIIKNIDQIVNGSGDAQEKLEKLKEIQHEYVSIWAQINPFGDFGDYDDFLEKIADAQGEVLEQNVTLAGNIKDIGEEIRQDFDLTTEHGKEAAKEAAENYLNHLNNIDERTKKFAAEKLTKVIGIQIDWGNIEQEVKSQVYNDWRDVAASLDTTNTYKNTLKNVKSIKDFGDDLGKTYRQNREEIQAINRSLAKQSPLSKEIGEAQAQTLSSDTKIRQQGEQRLEQLRQEEKQYKNSLTTRKQNLESQQKTIENTARQMNLDLTNEKEKNKAAKQRKQEETAALKAFKERIKLIRQAGEEYKKLRKYDSVSEATAKVRDMYKTSSIGGLVLNMTFDEEGINKQLDKELVNAKKYGKEAISAVQEGIRENQRDIEIRISKKSIDDAKKELDDLFNDYDFSKDLLDEGFNKYEIKTIFNVDTTSLKDVEAKIEEIKARFGELSEEEQKTLEEYSKKLQEIQEKELLERTKKYAEYLKYQYSEATKIMLQLKKDMAEVDTLDFTDAQKQSIKQNLQEKADKELQKQTWKDFQGSDMYTQMFDDLSKVSSKGLDYMVERLESLKDTLNDLDPSDLKEIINQINKLKEEQIQRNPLEGLGGDIKDAWEFAKNRKELEEQITAEYEKQKTLIGQIPQQEQQRDTAENIYNMAVSTFGKDSSQANAAKKNLDNQEKTLADMKQELSDSEKNAEKLKGQYDKGAQAAENVKNKTAEFANKINQAVDSMQTLVDGLNSVFNMGDGFNDTMSSIMEFGTNMANTVQSAGAAYASFATGDIFGGITQGVSAIGGLMSSIGSLFNIGDKKKEREIQKQLKLVEDLQHAYEKLEKAIDDAYSLDTYKAANDKAKANLEEQRAALEKALAAAQSKKKVDKEQVEDIQEQIESVDEQLQQLAEDTFNTFTGDILSDVVSAADSFVDAWLNAFQETGDGMQGLEDSFNDMITNLLKRQASMLIVGSYIDSWKKQLEQYINEDDLELTTDEAKRWVNSVTSSLPALNDALESYFNAMKEAGIDLNGTANDELSGLQKGIQSITEETAQALEAILESMRFYVADENDVIHNIYNTLIATDATSNPMLAELQSQTTLIRSIEGMMSSVIKVSGGKGRVLRVELV